MLKKGMPQSSMCYPCGRRHAVRATPHPVGPLHPMWKGGRSRTTGGYFKVWIAEDDPLAAMRNKGGYVYEHRLIAAREIGRPLRTDEEVHHLNGEKGDNGSHNLEIMAKEDHSRETLREVTDLKREIHRLKAALREAESLGFVLRRRRGD